jgi:hypothetical protein
LGSRSRVRLGRTFGSDDDTDQTDFTFEIEGPREPTYKEAMAGTEKAEWWKAICIEIRPMSFNIINPQHPNLRKPVYSYRDVTLRKMCFQAL